MFLLLLSTFKLEIDLYKTSCSYDKCTISYLVVQFVLLSLPKLFYFNFICFSMSFPICLDVYLSVSLEIQLLEYTQCAFSLCV